MGALRNVAWGLLVVVVDISLTKWDLIADPIGWAMVALALRELRQLHVAFGLGAIAATVALVASIPEWFGVGGWPVSVVGGVANLGVLFATCTAISDLVPARRQVADQLRWWGLGLTAFLWPVAFVAVSRYDGEIDASVMLGILAGIGLLVVFVRFLVLLFQCSRLEPTAAVPSLPS